MSLELNKRHMVQDHGITQCHSDRHDTSSMKTAANHQVRLDALQKTPQKNRSKGGSDTSDSLDFTALATFAVRNFKCSCDIVYQNQYTIHRIF